MKRKDLNFERGDKDIVFVDSDLDMEKVSEKEEPREFLKEEMSEEGLKWKNARILGIFQEEFSIMLQEDGKVILDGEQVYPE